jgi:hypothetical protein
MEHHVLHGIVAHLGQGLGGASNDGTRTVEAARKAYAEQATAFMLKRAAPYTEGFQFEVARDGTADRDRPTMGPMMKEAAGLGGEKSLGTEERPRTG